MLISRALFRIPLLAVSIMGTRELWLSVVKPCRTAQIGVRRTPAVSRNLSAPKRAAPAGPEGAMAARAAEPDGAPLLFPPHP